MFFKDAGTSRLTSRDPVAFQNFANHLAPKPMYGNDG
jgi:hypothetical protein